MAKKTAKATKGAKTSEKITAQRYVSPKMSLENLDSEFKRADLIFDGLDHSGASFEARVFLNNEAANDETPPLPENGYAGSFYIFGHGGCFGDDITHCQIRGLPRPYDPRPAHPLTPARKVLIATDAIRQALGRGTEMTVTVVPVVTAGTPKCDYENVLKFDRVSVVTYV
jgi:tyrosinase